MGWPLNPWVLVSSPGIVLEPSDWFGVEADNNRGNETTRDHSTWAWTQIKFNRKTIWGLSINHVIGSNGQRVGQNVTLGHINGEWVLGKVLGHILVTSCQAKGPKPPLTSLKLKLDPKSQHQSQVPKSQIRIQTYLILIYISECGCSDTV